MVPDRPETSDYPASPWQTAALFTAAGVVWFFFCWGVIDFTLDATGWFGP